MALFGIPIWALVFVIILLLLLLGNHLRVRWMHGAESNAINELLGTPGRLLSRLSTPLRGALSGFATRITGSPERFSSWLLILIIFVSATITVVGTYLFATSTIDTTANSGPILRTVAHLATNFQLWAIIAVLAGVAFVSLWWDRAAALTAKETRYQKQIIKRLAAEGKSTDGTVRLVGAAGDSEDQLRAKLMRAFAGHAGSDQPSEMDLRSPSKKALESGIQGELTDGIEDFEINSDELRADIIEGTDRAIILGLITKYRGYSPRTAHNNHDTTSLELLDAGSESESKSMRLTPRHNSTTESNPSTNSAETTDEDDVETYQRSFLDVIGLWRQHFQTYRMDLATSFSFDEFAWRFLLPMGVTMALIFTVLGRLWFSVIVYPVIIAASVTIGALFYGGYKWRKRRSLRSLRQSPSTTNWRACVTLAKRVDTPEQTAYYAWMAGRRYADYDQHRLARAVAKRWHQRLTGEKVAPAIQEKFARNLRQMSPTLHQFEYGDPYEGRKAIRDDIVEVLSDAKDPDGMVPKHRLCELVVQRGEGVGHDPDIVAEVYEEMIPYELWETDIELTDTDGNPQTVTAVHLRSRVVPDDLARIRVQFAQQFRADDSGTYDLPDVEVMTPYGTPISASYHIAD